MARMDEHRQVCEVLVDLDSPEAARFLSMSGYDLLADVKRGDGNESISVEAQACMEEIARRVGLLPESERIPLMATVAISLMWSMSCAFEGAI